VGGGFGEVAVRIHGPAWGPAFSQIEEETIHRIELMILMAMSTTTVPVKPETLARLRSYKVRGATYDDVLNELMDDHPPREFLLEHLRRLKREPRRPWSEIKKELDL